MEAFEQQLFNVIFGLYSLALIFYWAYHFKKVSSLALWAGRFLKTACLLHAADFALRAYIGFALHGLLWYVPWSNWFESFSLFAFSIAGTYWVLESRTRLTNLGVYVTTLLWVVLGFSMSYPFFSGNAPLGTASEIYQAIYASRAIPYLMPALQSVWMAIHVPVMFISYAAFGVAFAVGIIYLVQERQLKSKTAALDDLPPLEVLDNLIYRLIGWGFPVLTLGVILGARWAYDAWGRYWGWDAKETWALITWFVYAIYLHMRLVMSWRGRKTVMLAVFAFGVVMFTYIGVNYLSELHGFLSGRGA